jgi:uncharacterized protein
MRIALISRPAAAHIESPVPSDLHRKIEAFVAGSPHAVAGATPNRAKYGNIVLRHYLAHHLPVYAVNPNESEAEGLRCYADLASLPEKPHGVSIITRPAITAGIIDEAIALGIEHLWMQPGAEHWEAIKRAEAAGVNVIAGGACILLEM